VKVEMLELEPKDWIWVNHLTKGFKVVPVPVLVPVTVHEYEAMGCNLTGHLTKDWSCADQLRLVFV